MDIYERPDYLFDDEEPRLHEHLQWSGDEIIFGEMMPGDDAMDEEAEGDEVADDDMDGDDHEHVDGEEHDHDHEDEEGDADDEEGM